MRLLIIPSEVKNCESRNDEHNHQNFGVVALRKGEPSTLHLCRQIKP